MTDKLQSWHLHEMIDELWQHEEPKRAIWHKVCELWEYQEREKRSLNRLKDLAGKNTLPPNTQEKSFEIKKDGNKWACKGTKLPAILIDRIVELSRQHSNLLSHTFDSPGFQCKISFTREKGTISGIITTKIDKQDEPSNRNHLSETDLKQFQELIEYMHRFPKLRKHVFSEFKRKWKHLIDREAISAK
jgi:hypothetical protein